MGDGLDQIAEHFAESASPEELTLMHALMNAAGKSPLDVLNEILVVEG